MKFTMDMIPRSFKLFDDKGRQITDAPISGIDICIRPDRSTATIHVDFPSLCLELDSHDVTLKRTCKLVYRGDK